MAPGRIEVDADEVDILALPLILKVVSLLPYLLQGVIAIIHLELQ